MEETVQTLNSIWEYVLPIGGGVTIGAIVIAIATRIIARLFNKTAEKLNIDKIEETAVQAVLENLKNVSFKQTVQPLAESQLRKITEEANGYIATQLDEVKAEYQSIVLVLEKLSAYFDNSIAITDEQKQALRDAIKEAKNEAHSDVAQVVEVLLEPEEKTVKKAKKVEVER